MKKAFAIAKQHGLVEYLVSSSTTSNTATDESKLTTTTTKAATTTKAVTTRMSTTFPAIPARAPPPVHSVVRKSLGRTDSKSLKRKTPSKKNTNPSFPLRTALGKKNRQ